MALKFTRKSGEILRTRKVLFKNRYFYVVVFSEAPLEGKKPYSIQSSVSVEKIVDLLAIYE